MTQEKAYIVQDYMQRQVATIGVDATLRDAVHHMVRTKTNGLVVVDDTKKVVGVLSTKDVIQCIVPQYLEEDKHLASFEAGAVFAQRVAELAAKPIREMMTKSVHTIPASHALIEAVALMAEFRIRQLPVVDDAGVLRGCITRTNIKHAIADVLGLSWIAEA